MRSFTRVLLPILLVFGAVFGITFIQFYTEPETPGTSSGGAKKGPAPALPLKFFTLVAAAPREEQNPETGQVRLSGPLHLKHWEPEVEVGAPGHYAFWSQNRHDQPVHVRVSDTNCQCAGVDLAVVPADALRDYTAASALAAGPLCPAPGPAAALAHLAFSRRLTWEPLHRPAERFDRTVPAAGSDGPQFALVRLSWSGKEPAGAKKISAEVYYSLGDNPPAHQQLAAEINVVPAFHPIRREGQNRWEPAQHLPVGDLTENAVSTQEFFLASATRSQLVYTVAVEPNDPCVEIASAVPATPEEWASLTDFLRADRKEDEGRPNLRRPKSLYKVRVTVRERRPVPGSTDVHQQDLGPLERRLTVSAAAGGAVPLLLRGRVHGEVAVRTGAADGRIDLGSFSAAEGRSKDVILVADRPGLDLSLVPEETRPNYLKVRLDPIDPAGDRKQWRLRVTVPKGQYGNLPPGSGVVLKTNAPTPRRFRLPVHGMTYDSGGPKL